MSQTTKSKLSRQQLKRKLITQARLRTQCLEPDNKEQAVSPAN